MFDQQPNADETNAEALRKQRIYEQRVANLRPVKKGDPPRNPRGRPKKDFAIAEKAQAHAQDAIDTLVAVMKDVDAPASSRVSAAGEILDRGFGRAPQSMDVKHTLSLGEEFEQFVRSLRPGHDAKLIEVESFSTEDGDDRWSDTGE